jgi:hypothetical protein
MELKYHLVNLPYVGYAAQTVRKRTKAFARKIEEYSRFAPKGRARRP